MRFFWMPLLALLLLVQTPTVWAKDRLILLAGQSNMEGQGPIESQDNNVDKRFQMMAAVNCSNRTKGNWYTATPPLCRCNTGLCPADYFGREMVKGMGDSIRVGVIVVAVAGCDIQLFEKDKSALLVSEIANRSRRQRAGFGKTHTIENSRKVRHNT